MANHRSSAPTSPRALPVMTTVALIALTGCGSATTITDPVGPVTPVSPGVVAPGEWTNHGRDQAETRFSPLDQVHRQNVAELQPAWSFEIPKRGARIESTPIVADGVMYLTGPVSTVFALDARTGEELWSWDPAIPDEDRGGPSVCCGDVNRGVAIWRDKVFVGLLDGRLVALDRATGSVEWTVQTTPAGKDFSITGAPRIFRDKVIIGNGGAEYGVRGYVTAYDAETGDQVWRTYTVPGNPADGYEDDAMRAAASTWTGEWWLVGGGGTAWDGMAYDPDANLVYVGTGNGSPWNRDHRSPGGGDNLYLSSIIALDGDTGAYVWHYQTTPGDDWDYTATQPLMLLDLEIDGRMRNVIVQAPKNGFFYVIDRRTGAFISAQPYADDVNWATGIDPRTGRPIEAAHARYGTNQQGAWIAPGPTGAHNWRPMAWNPDAGLVYLPAQNNSFWYEMIAALDYQPGQWNTGTVFGPTETDRPTRPPRSGPPSLLKGWDPVGNREVWRVTGRGGNGGTLSTGGDLVFWGTGREMLALDAETGDELWAAPVGTAAGTPMTYSLDGRQYVTIPGGVTGSEPPTVWTFTIGGAR